MESLVQIQLIDTNQGYLDLAEGTNFPINFGISDVRDLTKRKGTTSKTIKLAGSKNNNKLLNNYFDVNVIAGTFDINKLQRCAVIQEGIVILDDVYLQLTKVIKSQTTGAHDQLVSYEVVIKDSTSDFFTIIGNAELTDLQLQTEETYHIYNSTNLVASWDHTWEDTYKYVMPINNSIYNTYNLNEWLPGIYAKVYWDKIFESAGYIYEWDTHTGTTHQFDKLIIPFNGDQAKLLDEVYDDIAVVAQSSGTTTESMGLANPQNFYSEEYFIVDEEISDPQGFYTPSTSTYNNTYHLFGSNTLRFEIEIDYDIIIDNNTAGTVYLTNGTGQWKLATVAVNNGVGVPGSLRYPTNSYMGIQGSTPIVVGDNVVGNNSTTFNLDVPNQNIGGNIKIGYTLERNTVNAFTGGIDLPMKVRINSIKYRIIPNVQTMAYSLPVFLNAFVPKKIKQSDFLKAFVTLYNLYIEIDPTNSKKLIIKSRDKYYDDGKVENWTKLLNKDADQTIMFLPELSKKKLKLTYKQDDSDAGLKAYFQATNDVYGEAEYKFDNEYTKDIETKEIIFSPTIITESKFGAVTPSIPGVSPKNNIRLLYDGGMFPCSQWFIYDYGTTGTSGLTQYPLFSHMDDPYDPTFDINFGQCGYYSVNGLDLTNNNMYNLHWRRTLNQMNSSKMLTASFDLKASDIQKMRLSDKIRIDNSWWNINKITDYNPTKEGPTKVELLSIDDDLKMVPFKTWTPPTKPTKPTKPVLPTRGGWGSIEQTFRDTTKKRNTYTNSEFGTTSILDGRDNVVGSNVDGGIIVGDSNISSETSFIFGSNNIVEDNVSNAFIVGNNITADTSNTLYTNNIVIDGTFNGLPVSAITTGGGSFLPLSGGSLTGGLSGTSLNLSSIGSGIPIINLGLDSNGNVVTGTTGGASTFTGGTITGPTTFTNGLSSNTIFATTYQNLPTDIRVTGGTYNNSIGTATFTNNIGGTFAVTGFTTGSTGGGSFLPLSGGTMTGNITLPFNGAIRYNTTTNIKFEESFAGFTGVSINGNGGNAYALIGNRYDGGIELGSYEANSVLGLYSNTGSIEIYDASQIVINDNSIVAIGVDNNRDITIADNTATPRITTNTNKKAVFIGSKNSKINSGITNSVVIGGEAITATTSSTVYVPNLNIKTVGAGTPIINLGIDSSGNVVTGTTSSASLSYIESACTADVTMALTNTWYTGTQIVLSSGTWLINAHITLNRTTTTAQQYQVRVQDTTNATSYASSQQYQASVTNAPVSMSLTTIITLAGTANIAIQGASSVSTNNLIKAATLANSSGNNATKITAIKVA